jgi:hypothetical protein
MHAAAADAAAVAVAVATKDEVTGIMVVVFNVVGVAEEVATTTEAEADATHNGADALGINVQTILSPMQR